MMTRKQELLLELFQIRAQEKEEAEHIRQVRFQELCDRESRHVKISGFNKYFDDIMDYNRIENENTFRVYNNLSKKLDESISNLEKYYKTNDHKNLLDEFIEIAGSDKYFMTALIVGNTFK